MEAIRFYLNDVLVEEAGLPATTTLLGYLRERGLTGTKEGCAEGDCGACTAVILDPSPASGRGPTFRGVNSCLVFLPMLQNKRVYTVEALRDGDRYHPVQVALAEALGSQCGYCTPGIVMSMFEACYRDDLSEPWQIDEQMCGNLCRCTGYRPIRDATRSVAGRRPDDRFAARLRRERPASMHLAYQAAGNGGAGGGRYYTPEGFDELFALRATYPDAPLVAGGTDLGLEVTKRFGDFPVMISVEGLAPLREIGRRDDAWRIGAAVTLTEVQETMGGEIPALEKMLRYFASRQIRNRATVGGNLCTASPIGDLAPVLLALGARAILRGADGPRSLPLDEFFVTYRKTALAPGEILEAVEVPHVPAGARVSSYKVSKRRELDISAVAAGCFAQIDEAGRVAEVRLAYGGMAPTPARARRAEAALRGEPWTEERVRSVLPLLDEDFTPISDHRGSAWYRAQVARNLLLGFYLETRERNEPRLHARPTGTVHLDVAQVNE